MGAALAWIMPSHQDLALASCSQTAVMSLNLEQRDRVMSGPTAWFQSNWRPAHVCLAFTGEVAKLVSSALDFRVGSPRGLQLRLSVHFGDGTPVDFGAQGKDGKDPELIWCYFQGVKGSNHQQTSTSQITFGAGPAQGGMLGLAEHWEVKRESQGSIEIAMKLCTNVTSKNHSHRRLLWRAAVSIPNQLGQHTEIASCRSDPLPWVVREPSEAPIEVISDCLPGSLVTLVGE